jgi:hypothetical protein
MQGKQVHLSDEELLLFSDQELTLGQAAGVREHVAQCEPCRSRLKDLESASRDFADLHEQEICAESAHLSISRELLKARLSEASAQGRRSRCGWAGGTMIRQLASACLALLLVVVCTWGIRSIGGARSNSDATKAEALALPRRALTPGLARAIQVADLCNTQDLGNDPPVNASLEQAVFSEYGVSASSKKDYELDYLITPALGGSDNIRNLWPEPHSSIWNARVKDQLEDHLHTLVCEGKVQLTTAQNDIATDWIAAYKRYFDTDKPEPSSAVAASLERRRELRASRGRQSAAGTSRAYSLALSASSWRLPAAALLR